MTQPDNTSHKHNPEADLALIRSMMAAGRRRAGVDGAHLILWGFLLMATFFIQYASVVGYLPPIQSILWGVTIIIGWSGSMILGRKMERSPQESNPALTAYVSAWLAVGITMLLHFTTSLLTQNFDPRASTMLSTGVFGVAFFVMAQVLGLRPFLLVAAGWWLILAYVVQLTRYPVEMLLVMGVACGALILVPGLFLRRLNTTGQ